MRRLTKRGKKFKGYGHDTDEWRDYDEDNVPFERLEKVYVPDEDSSEERIEISTVLNTLALLVDFLNERWFMAAATSREIFHSCFHDQLPLLRHGL